MFRFRLPHLHSASRRKSKPFPLQLERLEDRQTLSQSGIGASLDSFVTLNSFNGANGATPASPLVLDAQGNLFGTTIHGGVKNEGTVFVVPAGTSYISAVAFLNHKQGSAPAGSLVVDTQDNIVGTAARGGHADHGTVFALGEGTSVVSRVGSFNGTGNGSTPAGGLIAGGGGNLYGTTKNGGPFNAGTVFVVNPGNSHVTTLAHFGRDNGAEPSSAPVRDSRGDLFGTAYKGGTKGQGTVWEIAAGTNTIIKLASFNGTNGAHPLGPLVLDAAGNLYGTTTAGGLAGMGTVFEVAAGSNTITKLASFSSNSGKKATGAMVLDAQGDLFGTTQQGGGDNKGTVFEVAAGSSAITPLVTFTGSNGANPTGSLVMNTQGDLLGTTAGGGRYGKGTVFEISPGP